MQPELIRDCLPAVLAEDLYSLEADVHVSNLKSGTIYGFREASILPLKRSGSNATPTSMVKKLATPTVATNVHKVTFSDGAEHYAWSNWVYVVIQ